MFFYFYALQLIVFSNYFGQLGIGSNVDSENTAVLVDLSKVKVNGDYPILAESSAMRSVILTASGKVFMFGYIYAEKANVTRPEEFVFNDIAAKIISASVRPHFLVLATRRDVYEYVCKV